MDADKFIEELDGLEQIEIFFDIKLAPMADKDLILLTYFTVKNLHKRGLALLYHQIK